jgi:DNA-binding NarL/FixJ family response regulator
VRIAPVARQTEEELMKKAKPNAKPMIGIALVEDDPIRLVGMRSILNAVSSFRLISTSISLIATDPRVDVVLLRNSGIMFLEIVAAWRAVRPNLKIVVTGTGTDDQTILNAIALGARGYVDEVAPTPEFVKAITAVFRGSVWISRRIMSMVIERSAGLLSLEPQVASLGRFRITSREIQILEMLVGGRSNKEIGLPLGIKERTVKAHVARLMLKVGVSNRIALSVHAIRHSLVSAQ